MVVTQFWHRRATYIREEYKMSSLDDIGAGIERGYHDTTLLTVTPTTVAI